MIFIFFLREFEYNRWVPACIFDFDELPFQLLLCDKNTRIIEVCELGN